MEFFKPDQLALAAIIAGAVELLKGLLPKRLWPFLPFLIGLLLAGVMTVIDYRGIPPAPMLVANMLWRGIAGAVLAMAGFDVVKKGFVGGIRSDGKAVSGNESPPPKG